MMKRFPVLLVFSLAFAGAVAPLEADAQRRPNILIAISDDQSYPHASAYGAAFIRTPAIDRVAREGVLFRNGFAASPGCSPSRAAMLTGRYPWQIEHAGTHASSFPAEYVVFPDLLESAGYHIGFTGKGWGPGNWEISGRTRNPAGPQYSAVQLDPPFAGISRVDYAGNFRQFLGERAAGQPFYFWYGASEPHRVFEPGAGVVAHLDAVEVPEFLPDVPEVRADLQAYAREIEWFDRHLGEMIRMLEEIGELENTLIIVTSDNGMAFPRAKANVYEYGIHVPLVMSWGSRVPGGRVVHDLANLIDLAPTILEATGVAHTGGPPMTGRSLLSLLTSSAAGWVDPDRDATYAGRERHSSSRWDNLAYPQRAIRTPEYLYIRNFKPERWPAGAPRKYESEGVLGPMHGGYHDIDAAPSLDFLIQNRDRPEYSRYFHLAVDRRPAEELYNILRDPACLVNLALAPEYEPITAHLRNRLLQRLTEHGDPRVVGNGDIWETYTRYSPIRSFPPPEWALPPTASPTSGSR